MRQILLVSVNKKTITLIMNGILKMAWVVHIFLHNQHMVPIVYALLCSYLEFKGQFRFFPQTVLCWHLTVSHSLFFHKLDHFAYGHLSQTEPFLLYLWESSQTLSLCNPDFHRLGGRAVSFVFTTSLTFNLLLETSQMKP